MGNINFTELIGKGGKKVREGRNSGHFCHCQPSLVLDFENKLLPYL